MFARCSIRLYNLKEEYDLGYTLPSIDVLMAIQLLMAMWQFEELSLVQAIMDHNRKLLDALPGTSAAIPERMTELRQTNILLEAVKRAYVSATDKETQWQIKEVVFPLEWAPVVVEYFNKVEEKGRHYSGFEYCRITGDQVIARQLVRHRPGVLKFYPDGKSD